MSYEESNHLKKFLAAVIAGIMIVVLPFTAPVLASSPRPEKIYFTSYGDLTLMSLEDLAKYYQNRYSLTIEILDPLSINPDLFNRSRKQLVAEALIEHLKGQYREIANDPHSSIIVITETDMYTILHSWNFTFSKRTDDNRFAIVSSARMHHYPAARALNRLTKAVSRNIEFTYFKLPYSNDRHNVRYNAIQGIQSLDSINEDIMGKLPAEPQPRGLATIIQWLAGVAMALSLIVFGGASLLAVPRNFNFSKRKDYTALIDHLKTYAHENPKGYERRVLFLGSLGYLYIYLVLISIALVIAGLLWLTLNVQGGRSLFAKLLIVFLIFAWLIIKSLWIKIEPPSGHRITKDQAPKLFSIIEEIRKKQHSITPDVVLINNDFNAAVVQRPRLGILGWDQNYLLLGLPYMLSCDTEHFKAVLAHEFGHFSGAHGHTSVWTYSVRTSWSNIMENLQAQNHWGNYLFKKFFDWYAPYFSAYSWVLTREHEYQADRCASEYTGAKVNAQELLQMEVKSLSMRSYWENIWKKVNNDLKPPENVFSGAVNILKKPVPEDKSREYLNKSLKARTQVFDTHPSLKDRLAAIGYQSAQGTVVDAQGTPLEMPHGFRQSAAEDILDKRVIEDFLKHFDADWYRDIEDEWETRHQNVQQMKQELCALEEKIKTTPLTEAELLSRAYVLDQVGSKDQTVQAIQKILAVNPNNVGAHYRLGQLYLEDANGQGLVHLEKAVELDPSCGSSCLDQIIGHLENKGDFQTAEKYFERYDAFAQKDQEDYQERNTVAAKDQFLPHGFSQETITDLCAKLRPLEKELRKVYLVKKELKVYPQKPMYIFVVDGKPRGFYVNKASFNQKLADKLVNTVQVDPLEGTFIFAVGDSGVVKNARKVPDSLIFDGSRRSQKH